MATRMTLWAINNPAIPTFYLDSNVQGILTSEQAARIATLISAVHIKESDVMAINYWIATDTEIADLYGED